MNYTSGVLKDKKSMYCNLNFDINFSVLDDIEFFILPFVRYRSTVLMKKNATEIRIFNFVSSLFL